MFYLPNIVDISAAFGNLTTVSTYHPLPLQHHDVTTASSLSCCRQAQRTPAETAVSAVVYWTLPISALRQASGQPFRPDAGAISKFVPSPDRLCYYDGSITITTAYKLNVHYPRRAMQATPATPSLQSPTSQRTTLMLAPIPHTQGEPRAQ
ncbi:hypothetical protein N656DRAFT_801648 [Canariomyces notabilis]|uniref:Uncharacterized protein n=1 Tax=Canariomyces notabilis TaxID=2074819 RepID=A0AAN6QIA1_9PEZI|nr:hypothetical protein N656DRAFT_801648 [Canariomyces arenarius]